MAENRVAWIVSDVINHLQDAQKREMLLSPRTGVVPLPSRTRQSDPQPL